ncbi:endonuclease/exonuclease/phosphatase (EEP) superfamily protein YafD [Sinobacterium caligoides]|uniref:Endonuclease/exonuclease/phosphatase (EEP) superfamily protein YafD n=1 Tax=Sinobacterium caligoides TaxID=933926 RepID=A0A3N2E093_9GAMM|nr:endonuclease/exonuclease/phosphatase family protein [Sinobacterium caligoides]ROS05332.1 endonuclease/exonuclease/phosphatase (EEP) superfamily protein YafD [Sinobacterium caligoides]
MRAIVVLGLTLVLLLLQACSDNLEQRERLYKACGQALTQGSSQPVSPGMPQTFRVLIWNVQKGENPNLFPTLQGLADDKDLVLLQEATLDPRMISELEASHNVYFAPGYQTATQSTGVLTASRVKPRGSCNLSSMEPILRTPKATALSLYPIAGKQQQLLVINIHGVNFSIGTEALREQMQQAVDWVSQHHGPIIFAGDFNTWSEERQALVDEFAKQLSLVPLKYENDQRKQVFGRHLDHLYTRGLDLLVSGTVLSEDSDHNPIMAVFKVKESVK